MAISSNSIFHFTKSLEALEGILDKTFKVSFSTERIDSPLGSAPYVCPMVSFCDIPLAQIKEHIAKYGGYGIGLTKEWAIRKGLCPVQYVTAGSLYQKSLFTLIRSNLKQTLLESEGSSSGVRFDNENINPERFAELDLLRYMKVYEGPLERGEVIDPCYRFYDEREWRYVPEHNPEICSLTSVERYETHKQQFKELASRFLLGFNADDIKYLIVEREDEIDDIIGIIERIKGGRFLEPVVQRLKSRILTREQIENDI